MDDAEAVDAQQETQKEEVKERPMRMIKIHRHDGTMAFADSVVEMAQVVLDSVPPGTCYKDIAIKLKEKLDAAEKGTWHVIVGTHFGANVTNDVETLVNFKIDEMNFLVFRSGPPDRPLDVTEGQE